MLWVALELPALPLQLAERGGESAEPLVISEGPAQRPVVLCANAAAQAAGIREGQAVAAAKALVGTLRVRPRDPAAETEALERLAAWAGQFTPMVAVEAQGIVLEVEASLRLFDGHARLVTSIRQGTRELGFRATVGVAPTPLAARVFARAASEGRQVRGCLDPADLAERAGDLPLFHLDWPAKTLASLTDLGIVRIRDVLQLPIEGIARRFGPAIALSLEQLLGRVPDPRRPYVPPPRFGARLELPAEADGVEALLFPLRRLLTEFEGAMRGRGAGVQQLVLVLEHGRRARTRVPLEFASPEREAGFILAIARERLGRLTLAAPTIALQLSAEALLAYAPREGTWLPGQAEQALESERLVERLAARLGKERVFGIALGNDHRPEKDWVPAFAGVKQQKGGVAKHGVTKQNGAEKYRHGPIPPTTRPTWLLNRPHRLVTTDGQPTLQGALALVAGPERIEAGWWDGTEVRRDYYVATNASGETFWIFREHRDPAGWFLHGLFA